MTDPLDDDRSVLERLYRAKGDPDGRLPTVIVLRNVVALAVAVAVVVQLAVWIAVSASTGRLASPWWLWTVGGGGLLLMIVWLIANMFPADPHVGESTAQPPAERPSENRWRFTWQWALRVVSILFLVSSLAQFVVWLVLGIVSRHFDSPWWAWSVLPFALVVGAVWVLANDEKSKK